MFSAKDIHICMKPQSAFGLPLRIFKRLNLKGYLDKDSKVTYKAHKFTESLLTELRSPDSKFCGSARSAVLQLVQLCVQPVQPVLRFAERAERRQFNFFPRPISTPFPEAGKFEPANHVAWNDRQTCDRPNVNKSQNLSKHCQL